MIWCLGSVPDSIHCTPEVVDELRAPHPRPRAQDSALIGFFASSARPRRLASLPTWSRKPWLMSLLLPRPAHLQHAARLATGDQLLDLLVEVVQLLSQGHPPFPSDLGCVGALTWLSANQQGPPRPIEVGNPPLVNRQSCPGRTEIMLKPVQVGVKTSHGTEGWYTQHHHG